MYTICFISQILTTLVLNTVNFLFSCTLMGMSVYSAFVTNKHCPFTDYKIVDTDFWGDEKRLTLNESCVVSQPLH
mgnify:FL=1